MKTKILNRIILILFSLIIGLPSFAQGDGSSILAPRVINEFNKNNIFTDVVTRKNRPGYYIKILLTSKMSLLIHAIGSKAYYANGYPAEVYLTFTREDGTPVFEDIEEEYLKNLNILNQNSSQPEDIDWKVLTYFYLAPPYNSIPEADSYIYRQLQQGSGIYKDLEPGVYYIHMDAYSRSSSAPRDYLVDYKITIVGDPQQAKDHKEYMNKKRWGDEEDLDGEEEDLGDGSKDQDNNSNPQIIPDRNNDGGIGSYGQKEEDLKGLRPIAKEMKTTYDYNVRSGITKIQYNDDIYKQDLIYDWVGNIRQMDWKTKGDNKRRGYSFGYDNLYRLKKATYLTNGSKPAANTPNYSMQNVAYDKHGNMMKMQLYGKRSDGEGKLVDELTMAYRGNQLKNVKDAVKVPIPSESEDFKNNTPDVDIEYTYNKNGSITSDLNKGIINIQYNSLNLPQSIAIDNAVTRTKGSVTYLYSSAGVKLRTIHSAANNVPVKTTNYADNKIYENGELIRILVDGGYFDVKKQQYYFYVQDHLGNNRLVADQGGQIVQKTHYYPFGSAFAESTSEKAQPYKYNGKELDKMCGLNLYDYSARHYDAALARFTTVDPLAERKPWLSPYIYCSNNPINRIDPDGRDDYRLDRDGNLHFVKQTDALNHTLYATNSKGILDRKNSFQVDKSILNNKESVDNVLNTKGEMSTVDIYTSWGSDQSTAFFEFAARNTDVEWSHIKTLQHGKGVDYISTSHNDGYDISQGYLIRRIFKQNDEMLYRNTILEQPVGINITVANHSHTNNSSIVSDADVNTAIELQSRFPNAIMHNYAPISRSYTEFDLYSKAGELPPVEIIAPRIKKK